MLELLSLACIVLAVVPAFMGSRLLFYRAVAVYIAAIPAFAYLFVQVVHSTPTIGEGPTMAKAIFPVLSGIASFAIFLVVVLVKYFLLR